MRKHGNGFLIGVLTLGFLAGAVPYSFGEQEIDLGDTNVSAPATTSPSKPVATPTPASQEIEMEDNTQAVTEGAPVPTPTVVEIHGVLKMKDVYEAGISAYKGQEYDRAIRYLNKAVEMKNDPYTPKFYYAEAYATLGVIYQYHIIHYGRAYRCYAEALKYERGNATARRHIKQVYKYRRRKD